MADDTRGSRLVLSEASYNLARLRGFSDGVFAIAITITVLQLVVPETDLAREDVATELFNQWPIFLSLVIGFVVVGYYWLNHHRVFELLDRANGPLLWLNHVLLLVVVFMPYPTEILGLYHEFTASWTFFHLSASLVGLLNSAIWFYATKDHRLVPAQLDAQALRVYRWRSTILPITFLLAAAMALVGPWWSFASLSLLVIGRPIVTRLVGRVPEQELALEAASAQRQDEATFHREELESRSETSSMAWLFGGRSVSSLERLIAFTDGVYAIAITLLSFQFLPPTSELTSNAALAEYLTGVDSDAVTDLYVGYITGFLVIGLYWFLHHRYFSEIRGQDAGLRVLSLLHLFFIALLPDATEFLSVHHGVPMSIAYYSFVAGMVGLTISFIWRWASWRHRLIDLDVPDSAIRRTSRISLIVPSAFFVSIPLAFVIGIWSQALWLAAFLVVRVYILRFQPRLASS
jgi:uncharacterized membrane protein